MAIVNAKEILQNATRDGYTVGAFNITSIVQMKAVIEAAVKKKSPVIIQTSVGTVKFLTPQLITAAFNALAKDAPVPICLHLDHCTDLDFCKRCADAGYTNIMIDASLENFEVNVQRTKEIVDYCHKIGGISVEGELGTVMGVEDDISIDAEDAQLCDPDKALEFVERTGVDLFAPAIGTAHGMYQKTPNIDFSLLEHIGQLVNGDKMRAPLVIHGGTGLSEETIKRLISLGGAKFNVSTDLKHCIIDSTYDYLQNHQNDYNPGKLDQTAYAATVSLIEKWIDLFGSADRYGMENCESDKMLTGGGAQ
ncbi:class II fructose-bisphosphate aldolase [Bacillus sp. FJAT-50079]|uniref:class II fructose-bisphosphate aldolase n=1 Tax=Bacillus sp. FJAT-50079 TaxID=2833577 RepID=UPI001BC985C5|nr:class II fructose-bisphosphate aldolase [Bacillus sp. FJAT-50079]MBS4208217.1 class II fructose-bisphosphate aldolase [Bacillus sp. FJAT-50079]